MHDIVDILNRFDAYDNEKVSIHGRIIRVRKMKRLTFADLLSKDVVIQILFDETFGTESVAKGDWVELSGVCFRTRMGERTIRAHHIDAISRWALSIDYANSDNRSALSAFHQGAYSRTYTANAVRAYIREFFLERGFLEVQTPVLLKHYNGGRSFPVTTHYLNETLGFNRSTMEESMQALIGMGYERIFQIGSVFRSANEYTFLEGYMYRTGYETGQNIIRELCAFVAKKMRESGVVDDNAAVENLIQDQWEVLNFFEALESRLGFNSLRDTANPETFLNLCLSRNLVQKRLSPETLADAVAQLLVSEERRPVIITHFPNWSSPLYAATKDTPFASIERSRMYLPGQVGGFDLGLQENNPITFDERIKKQRDTWMESNRGATEQVGSDLQKIISAGLPPMFGFGLNPDRLASLWHEQVTINPFR